jgi:hypothetical protein
LETEGNHIPSIGSNQGDRLKNTETFTKACGLLALRRQGAQPGTSWYLIQEEDRSIVTAAAVRGKMPAERGIVI